jgi:hypothetical protein
MTGRVWVALWHGGISYGYSSADDAETFGSIREAADAMRDRRNLGHWQPQTFRYVFRDTARDLTPCAHDDNSGDLRLFGPFESLPEDLREYLETDAYPDRVISFGPRGGIRIEFA